MTCKAGGLPSNQLNILNPDRTCRFIHEVSSRHVHLLMLRHNYLPRSGVRCRKRAPCTANNAMYICNHLAHFKHPQGSASQFDGQVLYAT